LAHAARDKVRADARCRRSRRNASAGIGGVAGWYTGAGIDVSVGPAVRAFGEAQAIWLNDSSRTITGRGGVKVAF